MSTPKKLLVIIGITGNQGGSVAQVFQSTPTLASTWRLRGITRNPSKPSNAPLLTSGIELVAGDLDDPASLERAFEGADAILSVTDFWNFTTNPDSVVHVNAARDGVALNVAAMEYEIQQGKNIFDAAAKAHSKKPLHRLVISTLADSKKWSNGEITKNLHYDGKAAYCQYLKETYPSLARVASYVQVGYYLSNALAFPGMGPRKGEDGTWVLPTMNSLVGKPLPFVNPPADMGYFVEALITKAPAETVMLGFSESMTFEQYVKLWAKTLGVQARAEQVSVEGLVAAGLPEWLAEEVHASGTFVSKYGWDGGEPGVKSPQECGVDISKLTNVEKWIKEQDWKL